MKALTFKKSAIAAALLATAGAANANSLRLLDSVSPVDIAFGDEVVVTLDDGSGGTGLSGTLDIPAAADALSVAYEFATDAEYSFIAAVDAGAQANTGTVLGYYTTTQGIAAGNLVRFTFANGGIAGDGTTYKVVAYPLFTADQNLVGGANVTLTALDDVATTVVAKEEVNGVISSLTFSAATLVPTDHIVLLVESTSVVADTVIDFDNTTSIAAAITNVSELESPEVLLNEGVANGASVTADIAIIDSGSGSEISAASVAAVEIAETARGITTEGFAGGASTKEVINFANDALTFVGAANSGKTVTTDSSQGMVVEAVAGLDVPFTIDNSSNHFAKASFTVTSDVCDAIDTADNNEASDDLFIGSNALVASSTDACTWTSGLIDVNTAQNLSLTVDGETTLTNASWTYSGVVSLGTSDFSSAASAEIAEALTTISGTAFTFTSDVQGDGFELPYIYHIGSQSGYFSFVKLVNQNAVSTAATATNEVEVAFNALIKNTSTGEEFTVSNYKLGVVANSGQAEFNGTDVINALNTPLGTAAEGFNETAMDLDTAQNYHIALTLIPRDASTNDNFYVDVQNTAPAGRAQGVFER